MIDYPIKDWSEYLPEDIQYVGKWVTNWFSNFGYCGIEIDGIIYGSVENYYQSHKEDDPITWRKMARISPKQAKQIGRHLTLRPDWEEVKIGIMRRGLEAKFSKEPYKSQLIETGNSTIVEWNNWGDKIWGADIRTGEGRNILGILLMEIRDKYTIS